MGLVQNFPETLTRVARSLISNPEAQRVRCGSARTGGLRRPQARTLGPCSAHAAWPGRELDEEFGTSKCKPGFQSCYEGLIFVRVEEFLNTF